MRLTRMEEGASLDVAMSLPWLARNQLRWQPMSKVEVVVR